MTLSAVLEPEIKTQEEEPKYCAWSKCGLLLVRRGDEGKQAWVSRQCCGREHAGYLIEERKKAQEAMREYPVKYCAYSKCGKLMTPRRQEGSKAFAARLTCGVDCKGALAREKADIVGYSTRTNNPFGELREPSIRTSGKAIPEVDPETYEAYMQELERMYS